VNFRPRSNLSFNEDGGIDVLQCLNGTPGYPDVFFQRQFRPIEYYGIESGFGRRNRRFQGVCMVSIEKEGEIVLLAQGFRQNPNLKRLRKRSLAVGYATREYPPFKTPASRLRLSQRPRRPQTVNVR
jgi:hypothetical protein